MAQVCVKGYSKADGTRVKGYCYDNTRAGRRKTLTRQRKSRLRSTSQSKRGFDKITIGMIKRGETKQYRKAFEFLLSPGRSLTMKDI